MTESFDFEEIRPYRDEEISGVIAQLLQEPAFRSMLPKLFKETELEQIVELLKSIHTVEDFQKHIVHRYINNLQSQTTKGVEILGLENIDKQKAYIFISNHRDIVLDSALLNSNFLGHGVPLTEIAIGDNLLIYPWIKALVRINRSFIVQRNVPVRQMLDISKRLSAYIRHTIVDRNQSIWIAQREGRAKDSNDLTQEALLKMFNMSGKGSLLDNMKEISLCPLSISYEYDPCDYLKAKEFQQKRDNSEFKKAPEDDLLNMQTGIFGYKGKVSYYTAGSIESEIDAIAEKTQNKVEQLTEVASLIDKYIHQNYVIYPNNMVAYDMFTGNSRFSGQYNLKEKSAFETYIQLQIDKIDLPEKDETFLRKKMLEMYANPLINKLKAQE